MVHVWITTEIMEKLSPWPRSDVEALKPPTFIAAYEIHITECHVVVNGSVRGHLELDCSTLTVKSNRPMELLMSQALSIIDARQSRLFVPTPVRNNGLWRSDDFGSTLH
jgi:hypothetical protein